MSNSESVRAAEAEILAAFERFDFNRDGRISEAELVAILTRETSQRTSLSPDEAKQLFAKADLSYSNIGFGTAGRAACPRRSRRRCQRLSALSLMSCP